MAVKRYIALAPALPHPGGSCDKEELLGGDKTSTNQFKVWGGWGLGGSCDKGELLSSYVCVSLAHVPLV